VNSSVAVLHCSNCQTALPAVETPKQYLLACRGCAKLVFTDVFPAALRPAAAGAQAQALLIDDDSSCFYHPRKAAVHECQRCGRFLCALCDIEFGNEHLCSQCLEKGRSQGKMPAVQRETILYDNIALALAVYPLLTMWLSVLGAPAALFVALRYWRRTRSILPRSQFRMLLAVVLAVLQIGVWTTLFITLWLLV